MAHINWQEFWNQQRLWRFEARSLMLVLGYSALIGVYTLVSSILIQFLINSVAFVGQVYPIVIMSVTFFLALFFAALGQIIRLILLEILERRYLIRMNWILTSSLQDQPYPKTSEDGWTILHRFFEIFNYQTKFSHVIIDGAGSIGFLIITWIVLAFYHPWFSLIAFLILLIFFATLKYFGQNLIESHLAQSDRKYCLAQWFSGLYQNRHMVQWLSNPSPFQGVDEQTEQYLKARQQHFRQLIWLQGCLFAIQILGAVLFLITAFYLILSGQMSLGRLVAAEALIAAFLYNIASFGKTVESVCYLVTATVKLGQLKGTPNALSTGTQSLEVPTPPFEVQFRNLIVKPHDPTWLLVDATFWADFWNKYQNRSLGLEFKMNGIPIDELPDKFRKQFIRILTLSYPTSWENFWKSGFKNLPPDLAKLVTEAKRKWSIPLNEGYFWVHGARQSVLSLLNDPCAAVWIIWGVWELLPLEDQKWIQKEWLNRLPDSTYMVWSSLQPPISENWRIVTWDNLTQI